MIKFKQPRDKVGKYRTYYLIVKFIKGIIIIWQKMKKISKQKS